MLSDSPIYAYVPATDIKRARSFYEQKLGFVPVAEVGGGVFYNSAGGTGFFLYPTPNAGTSKASTAYWHVQDVEATVDELRAKGVVFEEYDMPNFKTVNGIGSGGGAKTAWFKDTEGNIMAVAQSI